MTENVGVDNWSVGGNAEAKHNDAQRCSLRGTPGGWGARSTGPGRTGLDGTGRDWTGVGD